MSNNNLTTENNSNNNSGNNQISGHHLDIQLHSAYALKGGSFLGTDSFFCTFNLRDGKNPKSSTVKSGSDIHWNETFQLDLPSPPEEETLFVNVLGKKKLFQNTLIGRLEIPLCLIIDYTDKTSINENHKIDKKFKLLPRYLDNNFGNTGFLHLSLSYSFSTPKNDSINASNQPQPSNSNSNVEFSYQCASCFQFVLPTMTHNCEESLAEVAQQHHYPPIQPPANLSSPIPLSVPQQHFPQSFAQQIPLQNQMQNPMQNSLQNSLQNPLQNSLPVGQSIPLSIPQINQQIHMHNTNINNINNNGVVPQLPQSIGQFVPQSPPQTITFVHKSPPQSPPSSHYKSPTNTNNSSNQNINGNSVNGSAQVISQHGFQIGHTYSNGLINNSNQPNGYQMNNNNNNNNNNLYNYQNIQNSLSDFNPNNNMNNINNINNNMNNINNINNGNNNININGNISPIKMQPQSPPPTRAAQPIGNEPAPAKNPLFPDLISLTPMTEQERQLRMLQQIQQKHAQGS